MYKEYYIREERIMEKTEIEAEVELIKAIIKTREDLKISNKNFEYAHGDLVDYFTFGINKQK